MEGQKQKKRERVKRNARGCSVCGCRKLVFNREPVAYLCPNGCDVGGLRATTGEEPYEGIPITRPRLGARRHLARHHHPGAFEQ